jgi:uncharacterized protein (DUF4415 family)
MPTKTNLKELLELSEDEVMAAASSDPDALPTDSAFWADATLVMPKNKEQITLKLDADVIQFFKAGGKGYNTRINAVLKSFKEHWSGSVVNWETVEPVKKAAAKKAKPPAKAAARKTGTTIATKTKHSQTRMRK